MSKNNNKNYFSQEKQEKTIKWIEDKWKHKECEVCKHNNWIIQDFLSVPPRFEGSISIGGNISPNVTLICKNCGNTKFFNAGIIGLLDSKKGEEDAK